MFAHTTIGPERSESTESRRRHGRMPRRFGSIAALLVCLFVGGCLGSDDDLFSWSFSVDEQIGEQTIPTSPTGGSLTLSLPAIALDLSQEPEYQNEAFDLITGVAVTGLSLSITPASTDPGVDPSEDGVADDFSFIDSISLWVDATIDGTTTSVRVAYLDSGDPQLDPGNQTVQFQMTGVNLLDYVEAGGGYTLRIEVSGTVPPDDVSFDGLMTYEVTVGLF